MKTITLGMALTMLAAMPAVAQTTSANTQSGATSTSSSGSSAFTGSSGASVTQVYNFADPSGTSGTAAGDPTSRIQSMSNDNVHYSGGYTVHNVPEVIPPSFGGTNVCAVGASGGVGVAGFGLSLGGSWSDTGCERRSAAVVLYEMGEHTAAVALMCQDKHVAEAMQAVGRGCGPLPRPVAASTPPVPAPAVAAAPPAPRAPALAVAAAPAAVPVHPAVQLAAAHPAGSGACAKLPANASAADRLMFRYNCPAAKP